MDIPLSTRRLIAEHGWPGNIRELENVVKRVVVLGSTDRLHEELAAGAKSTPPAPLPAPSVGTPVAGGDGRFDLKAIARKAARDAERLIIAETLDRVHWNRAKAARILQISYKALLYKIVDCGLAHVDESALGTGRPMTAPAEMGAVASR